MQSNQENSVPKFTFLRLHELAARPKPAWLVEGVFQRGGVAMLYGAPGGGKSFVVQSLAFAVAAGLGEWAGLSTQSGPAFYFAAEANMGLPARFDALRQYHGTLEVDNLFVIEPDLDSAAVTNLADPLAIDAIIAGVKARTGQAALVAIDTLNQSFTGSENDSSAMSAYFQGARRIARATGATVLVIHHMGKNAQGGPRGSTAITGTVDAQVQAKLANGLVTIRCEKIRESKPFLPLHFKLVEAGTSAVAVPVEASTKSESSARPKGGRVTAVQRRILQLLARPDYLREGMLTRLLREESEAGDTFYRLLARLEEDGLIAADGAARSPNRRYLITAEGVAALQGDTNTNTSAAQPSETALLAA